MKKAKKGKQEKTAKIGDATAAPIAPTPAPTAALSHPIAPTP